MVPNPKRLMQCFLLTPERWRCIFDFQEGCCAICKTPLKIPNTDHNHATGEVLGILCHICNRALGLFQNKLDRLLAAVAYIQNPPARAALGAPHFGFPGRSGTKKQRKLAKKYFATQQTST